jgi:transposase
MMGRETGKQPKLFYYDVSLEERIPESHILRRINSKLDFDFIYNEVNLCYGNNGNVSVPPPVILKMMLLLVLYNVRSERELIETLPVRLDWLWFLGFDIDNEIPNHSVLSKARSRWGVEVFKILFERIVSQCVQEGLVNGKKMFVDGSLIDANASENSVIKRGSLKKYLKKGYRKLEKRLDELTEEKEGKANREHISTTDPDASLTRYSTGKSKLRYKTHRAVDNKAEVITATKITPGSIDEAKLLGDLIDDHETNTGISVETAVGDSGYGTKSNFLMCSDRNIKAHMPNLEKSQRGSGRNEGIYPKEEFTYNADTDTFTCPAGQVVRKRNFNKNRQHYEYKASKSVCFECQLRAQCTKAKDGRTLKRHMRQDDLDRMLCLAEKQEAKQNIRTRQHLSERSFARSTRYGFKRSRWRRLWRVQIQDYLVAAIQNIQILVKGTEKRIAREAGAVKERTKPTFAQLSFVLEQFFSALFWSSNKKAKLGFTFLTAV